MESIGLLLTTFKPTVIAVVIFLLAFMVISLIVFIAAPFWTRRRTYRREQRINKSELRELSGRQRRQLERDDFFKNVQEIMHDFEQPRRQSR